MIPVLYRLCIVLLVSVSLILSSPHLAHATNPAGRYATCDACGLCLDPDRFATGYNDQNALKLKKTITGEEVIPANWGYCFTCLYVNQANGLTPYTPATDLKAYVDANKKHTLSVYNQAKPGDPQKVAPQEPSRGKFYTQFGCMDIGSEFENPNISIQLIQRLLGVIQGIAGGTALIYLMYGSFLLLTSRGDPERIKDGRRIITTSLVGIVFILFSVLLVQFLASQILRIPQVE